MTTDKSGLVDIVTGAEPDDLEYAYNVGVLDLEAVPNELKHRTRGGVDILLPAMDDDHVIATLNLAIRRIEQLTRWSANDKETNQALLFGAKLNIQELPERIAWYNVEARKMLAEAVIRGLDVSTQAKQLSELLGYSK